MSVRIDKVLLRPEAEPIPEARPWREAGWIFRDGCAVAIERQGDRTRARSACVSHRHDQ
jgi:hypothetical protein